MPRPRTDPEDGPTRGWCDACGLPCWGEWQDFGIGPYEFWGAKGWDEQWCEVSDCCEADILDHEPDPLCPTCQYEQSDDCPTCGGRGRVSEEDLEELPRW